MWPETSIKDSSTVDQEIKDPIQRDNSNPSQPPSQAAHHSNLRNNSHRQEYKLCYIKTTKETKTGFPILPTALKPLKRNISSKIVHSTKSSQIQLRKLPKNAASILIPGIRNFLLKSFDSAVKRRKSSRICKHKPGVKHYCHRRDWDTILSKYKTEVADNPNIDLHTFRKTDLRSIKKDILTAKKNSKQNKVKEPLAHTSHKAHSSQQMNSSNIGTLSTSQSSECDKTPQDAPSTSSNANSNNLDLQNINERDVQTVFLANLGLKRKVPLKEVINSKELKLVNAEKSNSAEAENTANINEISVGIDPEAHSIDLVEESPNEIGPDISSEFTNLDEIRDEGFQDFIENHNCTNPENKENSQEGKEHVNTSSEKNTETSGVNTTWHESSNKINGAHGNFESSSPQEYSFQVKPMNETSKVLESSVGVNNIQVANLLQNASLNVTSCPPAPFSISMNSGTKGPNTNNHEQKTNNIRPSNHVVSSFLGPFPTNSVLKLMHLYRCSLQLVG